MFTSPLSESDHFRPLLLNFECHAPNIGDHVLICLFKTRIQLSCVFVKLDGPQVYKYIFDR